MARIEAVNPGLNAFITFDREQVLGDAARLTEAQRRGDALGPLTTPAVSVPAGFTADGRPVGLQITGHQRAGAAVLRAAANFERARPGPPAAPPPNGSGSPGSVRPVPPPCPSRCGSQLT